jgi:uncharacterized protein (UPF0261 family)
VTPSVVLVGTLDTKGPEYEYVRRQLLQLGCQVILVDAGVLGKPTVEADIAREAVARSAQLDLAELIARQDRGAAVEAMATGVDAVTRYLFAEGRLHGLLGMGGSGATSLITPAMRALPIGVPKLMVSTVASGDVGRYVGAVDLCMMYSVVDVAGINRISERILTNAAAAIAGMARGYATFKPASTNRRLVAATMFGVTTPCVNAARERLEELGYEVLTFHAVGTGGRSMEALAAGGFLDAALDVTTTELADELVGGVFSAGPRRLEAAGAAGIPQVVSLGALDMVNFGPLDTVPQRFKDRTLYRHNPTVTLMRTTPAECAQLGYIMARKLNAAKGPVAVYIPLRGVSALATVGGVFEDAEADRALIEGLKAALAPSVEVHELDMDINDRRFARVMADHLHRYISAGKSAALTKAGSAEGSAPRPDDTPYRPTGGT